jgi:iron complex outermembrane receptor protein
MRNGTNKVLQVIVVLLSHFCLNAQEVTDSSRVFSLGEVTIIGKDQNKEESVLHKREIELLNTVNVAKTVAYVPGLSLGLAGGRNEAMVYVRGFDLRQVPVFVDGIPVSVPYDGYFDLGQMLIISIGKISIEKGSASLLYGANTMGGAINIISAKPDKRFSLSISSNLKSGLLNMDGITNSIQVGTRHNKWYSSAVLSYARQKFFTLPTSFDTTAYEMDRIRDNSRSENFTYNFKFGVLPKKGQEYSVSINGVRSGKGVPVYLGENPGVRIRFWRYPHWDKDGIYFHTKNIVSENAVLKTRWFYDSYYNVLKAYDNDDYDLQTLGYAFTSVYDDYQLGNNNELGLYHFMNHEVQLGTQFLFSHHKEFNKGEKPREMNDLTAGVGIEDQWEVSGKLRLEAGFGVFMRKALKAEEYFSFNDSIGEFETGVDESVNGQVGIRYRINNHNRIFAKIARKTRFATMKDRYSYRIGRAIPNPNLTSESAINSEAGYYATFMKLNINCAIFYSYISNTIQQVDNVMDDLWQLQNTGKSLFQGFELGIQYRFTPILKIGANYSFIDRQNLSNPDLYFIDVPKHQLISFLRVRKPDSYSANLEAKYNSSRYSTADGFYKTKSFLLFNISAEYQVVKKYSVYMAVENIFDKLHYYSEGYPEPGRVIRAGVRFSFESRH